MCAQRAAAARFGESGSFVDDEGYPYDDVETIIATRLKRQRADVLRNDLKTCVRRIEKLVPSVWANDTNSADKDGDSANAPKASGTSDSAQRPTPAAVVPILRVEDVAPGSPAHIDGLRTDDRIVRFGRVNSTRARGTQALAMVRDAVLASENKRISLVIERTAADGSIANNIVALTPRRWTGHGTLGCGLCPLE